MSIAGFERAAAGRYLGPLVHGELDGLLEPLSQAERRDVRDMLELIARRLAVRSEGIRHFRTRLDMVIASLIGVVDALDGDCDLEPSSEDEGAQCDDEGEPDDNGLADQSGYDEQMSLGRDPL
ncbi:hypothetical protein [Bosea sp. PAMC 26642]|uniref:hypothetical protein n=1 Tax=Bosea sp. (strain PAMC 26642) TaxID=1792307 RepID=UPI00076FFD93|nr:hypothetical protein [Bosea sp. PAMC 26642]AMJ59358.1 hypothetical protein AXW83_02715 [Bosea sp. PAMC 26642]